VSRIKSISEWMPASCHRCQSVKIPSRQQFDAPFHTTSTVLVLLAKAVYSLRMYYHLPVLLLLASSRSTRVLLTAILFKIRWNTFFAGWDWAYISVAIDRLWLSQELSKETELELYTKPYRKIEDPFFTNAPKDIAVLSKCNLAVFAELNEKI